MSFTVYLTDKGGEGHTNSMDFDSLDEIQIYTGNIGNDVLITIEENKDEA